jgi:diguanylate cyclase (GGDEF)-like protein/PAS domain S-box-containing protein
MRGVFLIFGITIVCIICYKIFRILWVQVIKKVIHLTTIKDLVENSRDIIYHCKLKPTLKFKYLSPSIETILGRKLIEKSMKNPYIIFERVHPDDYYLLEKKLAGEIDYSKPLLIRWKNDKGKYIWFEEYATPIFKYGEIVALQGIMRNIDNKVLLQQKLEYKVSHDSLTELFNREYFETKIKLYNKYEDVSIAIVICDLDELKYMNDHYGHKMGDKLIKTTAKLLKSFSNDDVVVARIGGDEFAILLTNTNPSQIESFLEKVKNEIEIFNNHHCDVFKIKFSTGYAYNHSSLGKMEELFVDADNKMYDEKNKKPSSRYKQLVSVD